MDRHVVVAGAGAAGMTAALRAAEAGARVTLLNAHPKIGLKILMSGGTRCNVTHAEVTERDYRGGSRHVVARVLRAFPADAARAWMASLGVPLKLEPTGKWFPESDDAQTVLDALLAAVRGAGVEVRSGARVVRLEPADGARWRLGIQRVAASSAFPSSVATVGASAWPLPEVAPDEWLEADAVILATGGLSFPRTGSDGLGFALARALDHTIVPTTPALTPLAAADPLCATLQGLTLEAELTLCVNDRRVETVRGSFLFTHFGYSGPAALDLSRSWLRAEGARRVTANFLPGGREDALREAWVRAGGRHPNLTVRRWLGERLPDSLVVALCAEVTVDPARHLAQIGRAHRRDLIDHLLERELPVTGTLGYEKAEATAGGVALAEVDPSTLESRKAPGVFLCGEMLDVDGRLGGFNFQWSWSSGTVAGMAAGREVAPPVLRD